MINKYTNKNTFPTPLPSSQAQLRSLSNPSSAEGQEMGVAASPRDFISAAPSPSHISPIPAWGPSHMLQCFKNCPSVGSLHGLQSLKNRLLQDGHSFGHSFLQGTFTCFRLGPSWCVDICSSVILHHLHAFTTVFSMTCRELSAPASGNTSCPSFHTDLGICRTISLFLLSLFLILFGSTSNRLCLDKHSTAPFSRRPPLQSTSSTKDLKTHKDPIKSST